MAEKIVQRKESVCLRVQESPQRKHQSVPFIFKQHGQDIVAKIHLILQQHKTLCVCVCVCV